MKRKKKNADAGIIYDQTGLSQQALALYIGAKQSSLSHHLAGTRLLLNEAGGKFGNLMLQLVKLPPPPAPPTLSAEEKEQLQQAAVLCRTRCIPLQNRLPRMKTEVQQAVRLLQLVDALEKEEEEMDNTRQRWYNSRRYEARYKLMKSGRYEQALIEAKIAALQKEAEVYEALLAEH